MNEIENWIIVKKKGFDMPRDGDGQSLGFEIQTSETKKKEQATAKASTTLQCGLTHEQLSKFGPF